MLKIIKNRIFLNIFLLFFLVGFLIFPKIILADDFKNITIKEANEYLELPEDKVEKLIHSLIKIFHSKWEDLMVYGQPTADQMAIPNIMKNVVRAQAMNYLLVDAPIDIAWDMINGGIKIARIFLVNDISGIINDLEKESVKKAIDYGLNILLQEGIKMTPGAIEFKYILRDNTETTIIIQYIIIYKPLNEENGELAIKFYSPSSIKPPKNKGSVGSLTGIYTELIKDLPPFTVNIQGSVKNYQWTKTPSMDIEFPKEVPDFGIKPIGFLEQHLVKPIENTIKEIEIIAKKITGKSLKITETWEKVKNTSKNFLSELNLFSPASLVEIPQVNTYPTQTIEDSPQEIFVVNRVNNKEKESIENRTIVKKTTEKTVEDRSQQLTLDEMQEILDDISEKIEDLSKEILVLNSANNKEKTEDNENDKEFVEVDPQQINKETILCSKNGLPGGNKIIFNEIAWMGTEDSSNDEWIELKNISGEEIDLNGWRILNGNNNINILFTTEIISQNNYFLLERTSDESVSIIPADFIYTGALRNTNETLYIFDENCQMQDMISDLPRWNSGDNESKQTMERKPNLTWQTSKNSGGTPKFENSEGHRVVFNYGSPSPTPTPIEIPQQTQQNDKKDMVVCSKKNATTSPTYSRVIFNEIAWMGSADSSANEWIELKNITTSTISLDNWQLIGINTENNDNKITVFFNENNEIVSSSFFLLERTDDESVDKIIADKIFTGAINDSDFTLRLFDDECTLIDEVIATSSWPAGQKELERKTMERDINLNWYTSYSSSSINGLFGTPKTENSEEQKVLTEENQTPTAIFDYQPQSPAINQKIIFDASSSTNPDGTITSYVWDFGDENSTTTEKATTTYSYSSSSEYIVSLQIVDDKNGTSSIATSSIIISFEEIPTLEVVINEIAWMGSTSSSADEWIELYNNTTSTIDVTGWTLEAIDGSPSIKFSTSTTEKISTTTISSQEFYLLERTDDTTISDVSADLIYTGALSNEGEILELRNASRILIDIIDCSDGWFAGTTTSGYISMERVNSSSSGTSSKNWANNNIANRNGKTTDDKPINGTPKSKNSVSQINTEIKSLPFNEFNEITLTQLGNPYIIVKSLTVPNNKTLIIEPGVILKFKMPSSYGPGEGPYFKVQGNLKAMGKENEQILFTSTDENMWPGIIFEASEPEMEINSYLEYVLIEKSRSWESPSYPAVKIDRKAVSIKNSTLDAYYNYRGIYMIDSYSVIDNVTFNYFNDSLYPHSGEYTSAIYIEGGGPTIKNSTFQTTLYGIFIQTTESCSENSNFKISSNTFIQNDIPIYLRGSGFPCFENNLILNSQSDNLNNVFDGIVLGRTTINYDTFWQADVPFIIERQLSIENATLTIASGMTIKFKYINDGNNRGFLEIKNGASLIAQGTTENKIFFTSAMEIPSPWNWKAIYFRKGSYGLLDNVEISYGGSGNTLNDCLKIETENILLTNVEKYQCSI